MKQTILIAITVIAAALLLPGCSHNTGAFTLGTRVNLGIDPQNATANASYTDGLNVVDVSRENASWDVEIDADNCAATSDRRSPAIWSTFPKIPRKPQPPISKS